MNIFNELNKNKTLCEQNEYCSIYLSYLGKYGKDSEEIKFCKNENDSFCSKYGLVDQNDWDNMNSDEKLELIKKLNKRS